MTYQSKLKAREEVAEGTMAFHFEKPAGFQFKPGQYADLTLINPAETDSEGNVRTFSIASAPYEGELLFATRMRDSAFKRVLGGVFGVTRGLSTAYPERVQNSPLAEASIVGVAGGMAIAGYKPIVEIQFADYMWPAFMQIRDEVPTVRWRSQGVWTCPVVIRISVGGRIKGGPWHSACVESFLAHIPGWHVVFSSSADDAKGLIKSAARSENPVIFLEHKALYRRMESRSREPVSDYLVPFGRGRIRREGRDATIVTWGACVYQALEVAEKRDGRILARSCGHLVYRATR